MLQFIYCAYCDGTNTPIGEVSVNVMLSKHEYCESCHNSKPKTKSYHFCSFKCFNTYIKEVADEEMKFELPV